MTIIYELKKRVMHNEVTTKFEMLKKCEEIGKYEVKNRLDCNF